MSAPEEQKAPEKKGVAIDLFTVLGHDLKSPLNAVESYLELIHGKVLGEQVDAYMPIVENSIARLHLMRELITDVVDWSRLQDPSGQRSPTPLDVSGTVRVVLDGLLNKAGPRGISVSAEIEEGITIPAVAREMKLLAGHLVVNAIKYNRNQGSVQVQLKRDGIKVILSVADTGIGIAPEDQTVLFREFMRIRNSQTQEIRGTGLGLAIVKKIVDIYGGTVQVESEPGKGSTFLISF